MPTLLSTHSPEDRARAAAALLALSRLGHVYEGDLLEYGRVVLGHDLDARRWTLPGLGPVEVRRGADVAAMRIALALAVSPRRVRLGASWIKDAAGKVTPCIPAALESEDFARWLRAETLAQVRQMGSPSEKLSREARAPRKYRRAALHVLGEYTHTVARGPEEAMVARETLADLLALACERDRTMVSMRVEGHSTTEIAARLGCSGRSVRRYFADLYGRGGPCALSVRRLRDVYRLEPCDNTSSATALASVSRPRSTAVRSFVARGSDSSTSRIFINPIRRFEAADRTPIRASPR